MADARFICQSLSLTASEIASRAKTIGESCVQFADQIDQVRAQINLELGVMLATIVALEVAAGLAAGPTAGVGTAALQVAVAGRVATSGPRIMAFLDWLLTNSTFTRGRLIWSTKGAIEAGVKSILGKIPKKPGLTPVAPVTTFDATASAIAASHHGCSRSSFVGESSKRCLETRSRLTTRLLTSGTPSRA